MDIQTMRIFQEVAKKGSFSAAVHELNYAQSNISLKMQQLDIDLAFVTGPVNHPDLDQIAFKNEDLVLVSAKTQEGINSWKDIDSRTLLVFPYGCTYRKTLEQLLLQ